ncbi:hypothetical protein T440DRAFT_468214 [Plenodomus tracheiphilus IPT5]|uniref:Uncharacterized protein n=1 Tax=Plenodomus tracheiphilus IPT5 TaxID=1408161 RepID=A0A6A7B5N4_9PLEO|nr:hypothetical protein T440DRAFT_468214 [Plenodomus tracheiphilus IPT5]
MDAQCAANVRHSVRLTNSCLATTRVSLDAEEPLPSSGASLPQTMTSHTNHCSVEMPHGVVWPTSEEPVSGYRRSFSQSDHAPTKPDTNKSTVILEHDQIPVDTSTLPSACISDLDLGADAMFDIQLFDMSPRSRCLDIGL